MKCPGCDQALSEHTAEELAVYRCAACGGLWIDNEASQLVSRGDLSDPARDLVLQIERQAADGETSDPSASPPGQRPCPTCGATMAEVTVPNTDVEVDVCAQHGTYFDRHELFRVYQAIEIKNTNDEEAAEAFGDQLDRERSDGVLKHSWLGRVFLWLRG